MKIKGSVLLLIAFLVFGCSKADKQDSSLPLVKSESTYDVIFEEDITYAKGLSHQSWNSQIYTTTDLKLDVYIPENDLTNRPAILLIHGGGFIGGSKQQTAIVNMSNYFASRGWVVFSIDYRIKNDFGTVPQEWINYSANLNPVDVEPVDVAQFLAMYPAHRDAKAALRWAFANANNYKINTNYITVGGGSAGAMTAVGIGISTEEDYKNEININEDNTLSTTHLEESYQVKTILDFWGAKISLDALEWIYGYSRFNSNNPPLLIVHGTEDTSVPFSNAEELRIIYENTGADYKFHALQGLGHGPWNAMVNGKSLSDLAFDYIVEKQNLIN